MFSNNTRELFIAKLSLSIDTYHLGSEGSDAVGDTAAEGWSTGLSACGLVTRVDVGTVVFGAIVGSTVKHAVTDELRWNAHACVWRGESYSVSIKCNAVDRL